MSFERRSDAPHRVVLTGFSHDKTRAVKTPFSLFAKEEIFRPLLTGKANLKIASVGIYQARSDE
jgi:hypothetical protein